MSQSEQRPDTVRLQKLARAFMGSASLFAAIDLKLFTAVAAGFNTPSTFASHADTTEINAERLMTMCSASGLLTWETDHYVNAPDVERFLVEGQKSYAAPWLTFTRGGWKRWGELTDLLKNQDEPIVIGDYAKMTVESARRYHEATASVGFGSGRRFSRQVDLSQRQKLLDIGGGSGAYSIVAVQNNPQLSAVVFDLPPVVVVTNEFIEQHEVAGRVSTIGGDFTLDEFPDDIDVAIMASNLPQYSRDIIQGVISKCYNSLVPGGEMHLIGEMLDDDRSGPPDAALWGLLETMANSTGITHTRADCVSYFESAGFKDIEVNEFIPDILVRVTGTRAS